MKPELPPPPTTPHPHVPHVDLHDQGQPEKVGGQSNAAQEGQQGGGVHHRRTAITTVPAVGRPATIQ